MRHVGAARPPGARRSGGLDIPSARSVRPRRVVADRERDLALRTQEARKGEPQDVAELDGRLVGVARRRQGRGAPVMRLGPLLRAAAARGRPRR